MAKRIKTIKCPQCGSVQKTEIKTDHFRCNSCGTEYFLDSDDVNVNVRHSFDMPQETGYQPGKTNIKKVIAILVIAVSAMLVVPTILIRMFVSAVDGTAESALSSDGSYNYYVIESTPVEIDGKVWIACFARRYNYNLRDRQEEWVYYFQDIEFDRRENVTVIEGIEGVGEYNYSEMRRFADGNCYLSVNKRLLFRLNKETMQFEDYLPHIRHVHDAFNTGVASVEISSDWEGDALEIMSNIGDEYAYFPIIDRVYTEKDRNRAEDGTHTLLPEARDSTFYMFNEDAPLQLLKINYKYNAGGPFSFWLIKDDFNGYLRYKDRYRITSYSDVAPGRRWFNPYVAYQGRDDLLVSVRANAAEDSQISIQKIDTRTGEVLWSTPVPTPDRVSSWLDNNLRESIRVGDRYILKEDREVYLVLGADGTLIKEINLDIK